MYTEKPMTWQMLAGAGGLMTGSGILMALCDGLAYGGILWAAASLLFFASRQFYLAEETEKRVKRENINRYSEE